MIGLAAILDSAWLCLVRATVCSAVVFPIAWLFCSLGRRIPRSIHAWLWRIAYLKVVIATFWIAPIELPILQATSFGSPGRATDAPFESLDHQRQWSLEFDSGVPVLMHEHKSGSAEPAGVLRWNHAFVLVWLIGFLFVVRRFVHEWNYCRRIRAQGVSCNKGPLFEALESASNKMRVARKPALLVSGLIDAPALMGLIRPAIVLPETLVTSILNYETELLFLHELGHLKRRDLFWNVLPNLVNAALFFSPFAWLARRKWYLAQEAATDEVALQAAGADQRSYAEMLLKIAGSQGSNRNGLSQSAAGAVASYGTLFERFTAMQQVDHWPRWQIGLARATTACLSIVCIIPWKAVPHGRESTFLNGHFESLDLTEWKIVCGPNAAINDQRVIPFDIDASGPKGESQVLALSIGQTRVDPGNYCHVDVTQSLWLKSEMTYELCVDWAATNYFSIDNFDGGRFQLVVDDQIIAECDTKNIYSGSTETGSLRAEFTPSQTGSHDIGARVSRMYGIPLPDRQEPALHQCFDNFSIRKIGKREPEELASNVKSRTNESVLHVNNQRVSDLFKSMRKGTYRGTSFPKLTVDDIPALLNLAAENRELRTFPRNPLSSQYEPTCREGIVAIWLIEGIRAGGDFPSSNALCLLEQGEAADWTEESNRTHERLLDAYRNWWKTSQRLSVKDLKEINPLAGTTLRWY